MVGLAGIGLDTLAEAVLAGIATEQGLAGPARSTAVESKPPGKD